MQQVAIIEVMPLIEFVGNKSRSPYEIEIVSHCSLSTSGFPQLFRKIAQTTREFTTSVAS